ncbi:MAG: radical SAM protein [Clostridia bacterium]|nr:radical SAM protein [Clostridia bacterium]
MPFYHVMPGETVIQIGTVSCNARCSYCINSHLAIEENDKRILKRKSAQQIVSLCEQMDAKGVVFAVNEVTCFLPSAFETAKVLHEHGLKVGCLTNGFQTEEMAIELAKSMDFINVSLKSISDEFYRKELGLSGVQPVLRNIRIFNENTHLEIVTPLVKEIVDGEIFEIMDFLESVNPELVWHLFRLMPNFERESERDMTHEKMLEIYETARKRLPYTYLGNFAGSQWVDTTCPDCGELLIKRICTGAWLGGTMMNSLQNGCCPKCGRRINGVF